MSTRDGFGKSVPEAHREGRGEALATLVVDLEVHSRWWQCSRAVETTLQMFSLLDPAIAGDSSDPC